MLKLLMTVVWRFPIISSIISLIAPCIVIIIDNKIDKGQKEKILKISSLCLCLLCILAFTLIGRRTITRNYNFKLFWKYELIWDPQFRREILGNIFLFIPFGFFLTFVLDTDLLETTLIGLGVSIIIEYIQYYFCLGLCELDDVFHNTLGTLIGYVYYKSLTCILTHYGGLIEELFYSFFRFFSNI